MGEAPAVSAGVDPVRPYGNSEFRIPHSEFRIPNFAFRIPIFRLFFLDNPSVKVYIILVRVYAKPGALRCFPAAERLRLTAPHNDHRMAKSIENSIDFAAKRLVWQRMIL